MKFIDELTEEEVEKIFGIIKKRLNDELSNAIKNASMKVHRYLNKENNEELLYFTQCKKCGSHYLQDEKHICEQENQNA
ncbi:hypothetical protein LEP1GSC059_2313 [Leptospira noguchii serovar Panama str. CZ214]|uniref:Uncharacterized protein n=1 Tax=Leptospira noguchii serovar Panama str. CZ214 TaxID=1001595 RepID=T0FHG1_9LEPT|nr:hypothetical protein LEP1GSC059_2313 [Leptospira noguchii serovar Panama str. CZ214]